MTCHAPTQPEQLPALARRAYARSCRGAGRALCLLPAVLAVLILTGCYRHDILYVPGPAPPPRVPVEPTPPPELLT